MALKSKLTLLYSVLLSIVLTVSALGFSAHASNPSCFSAWGTHVAGISSVSAAGVVRESEQGIRFDQEAFGAAWAKLLKSLPSDVDAMVGEGKPLKLVVTPKQQLEHQPIRLSDRQSKPLRLLVTAGIHGNEPLAVQTALDLVSAVMANPKLRSHIEVTLLPTLNEQGLLNHTRADERRINLNRGFTSDSKDPRILAIQNAIGDKPYDIALDLHGANRRKHFFVIKSGEDQNLAKQALAKFDSELLLHADDGAPTGDVGVWQKNGTYDSTRYTLEAPGLSMSKNVGTLKSFTYERGTARSYTLEYPGALPLAQARAKYLELVLSFISSHQLFAEKTQTDLVESK